MRKADFLMDIDLDRLGTPAETLRRAYATRWTWRTTDRASYRTGLLCQRAGVRYRGAVTPAELAAVDAVTIAERQNPLGVVAGWQAAGEFDEWPYIGVNELYTDAVAQIATAEVLAALLVALVLAVIGLAVSPLLVVLWLRATLSQRVAQVETNAAATGRASLKIGDC